MSVEYVSVEVTPTMAQEWLDSGYKNRNTRRCRVDSLARDMAEGRWIADTGDTIKLTDADELIDGKHRAKAVIKSGVSVMMTVAKGVHPAACPVLDSNSPRTAADFFGMRNVKYASQVVACARMVWSYSRIGAAGLAHSYQRPSVLEIIKTVDSTDIESYVAHIAPWFDKRNAPPVGMGLACGLGFLFRVADAELSEWFIRSLATGEQLSADEPVALVRHRLQAARASKTVDLKRATQAAFIVKAWNATRNGVPIKQLQYRLVGPKRELFPEIDGLTEDMVDFGVDAL